MKKINKRLYLFDKLYRESLQDNIIDKNEYESLCSIFTKNVDEAKNESLLKILI